MGISAAISCAATHAGYFTYLKLAKEKAEQRIVELEAEIKLLKKVLE
jgi:hypothetical protein